MEFANSIRMASAQFFQGRRHSAERTRLSSTHVVATFAVASGLPIVIIVALSFFNL